MMTIPAINQQGVPHPHASAARHGRSERPERPERLEKPAPGRAHLQQGLKHLLRDVRHDIRGELRELAASDNPDPAYSAAVKDLFKNFQDSLQDVFHAAGKGRTYDRSVVTEGVGQAMADLTAGLKSLREERDGLVTAPEEPAQEDQGDSELDTPAGILLDTTA